MASSSNGLTGAADENANAARVSAAVGRAAATAGANAAEAVGVSADHLMNEGLRNVEAGEQGRDLQFQVVRENIPAWVSAGQRLFRPLITPALQQELQQFNFANPGVAPAITPGRVYYLLPPGVDFRDDLANPGYALHAGCASYKVNLNFWGYVIRVLLHKSF